MAEEEVQGLTLKLKEEDLREACGQMGIPLAGLYAIWRHFRAADNSIQIADMIYVMALAKSKGLNPLANNYSLIPREGGKGFSLTFNKEAALHVINNHPLVKKGAIGKRTIITKGKRFDMDENPELIPGGWKYADVDWDLTAIFEIEAAGGGLLRGVAKYKACFGSNKDGNPKYLWLKDPAGMTMKQAEKDLANVKLDGALPDAEEGQEAALFEVAEPPKQLKSMTFDQASAPPVPSSTLPEPVSEVTGAAGVPTNAATPEMIEKGGQIGLSPEQIEALWVDQQKAGVTVPTFLASLDEEIERRSRTKTRKAATVAKPAAEQKPVAVAAEKPTEAPAETEKKTRRRAAPKPEYTVVGYVEEYEGREKQNGQKFLVAKVQGVDIQVWHRTQQGLVKEAYNTQQQVKVTYEVTGPDDQPDQQYASMKDIVNYVEEEAAPEPEAAEPQGALEQIAEEEPAEFEAAPEIPDAVVEQEQATVKEAEKRSDAPPSLFNW